MRACHQSDLIWRFQHADHQMRGIPSSMEVMRKHWLYCGSATSRTDFGVATTDLQLAAAERAKRIDRVLGRLPEKPVGFGRVLYLRYGPEEHRPSLREVLPNLAGIAAMTAGAKRHCERARGEPPRPRSNDLLLWLEALCHRISIREPIGDDKATLADVRCEAEAMLIDSENAYESWADRAAAA
jgi:hypothetical protein